MEWIFRVGDFTDGVIGPSVKMLGPVKDGQSVVFETAPGCWGPMITPKLRGGHEVSLPVAVEGAEVGDSIAIKVKRVKVKSKASSSGTHKAVDNTFLGDPFIVKKCPKCGTVWPEAVLDGIGLEAIRCRKCGAKVSPFRMDWGYTMVFDDAYTIGLTVGRDWAEKIAGDAAKWAVLPKKSVQYSSLLAAKGDVPGIIARVRPFMGQLGTTPSIDIPDSYNAGDIGSFLVGAAHQYSVTQEELDMGRTDGHLDVDSVREGAILICPVKIEGGGVYAGDMHAMQGDGEIASHTTDVSGELTAELAIIKGLTLEGPILFPPEEDLQSIVRPRSTREWEIAKKLAKNYGLILEASAPIQVIGTGPDLNKATDNGLSRMARLFKASVDEIRNRVTIAGCVEIGRLPGVVQISVIASIGELENIGIADLARYQYKLHF